MNRREVLASLWMCAGVPGPLWSRSATASQGSEMEVMVGDHRICARLYAPQAVSRYEAIVLIPGSGNESVVDSGYTRQLAGAFGSRGIACLAYDKRGTGQSTGSFTGGDFAALGEDAAAVANFARTLPQVHKVGLWGISQAGWVMPYAVRRGGPLALAILVSPAGVNPFEQVAYFLRRQAAAWGLAGTALDNADRMHRAVSLYYAGRESYERAEAQVLGLRGEPWFKKVVTHPYWDEMTPDGRILDPESLARAIQQRPGDFEIYRSESSFHDFSPDYADLRLPTLNVYGAADTLIPIAASRAAFESVWAGDKGQRHDFHVFDEASHDIETPDGAVLPAYLELISAWARLRFDESP
jgi:pimeloyl-ACP methyl ester carboxylesterase